MAAALVGLAAFIGLSALRPAPPVGAGVPTVVAARSLATGAVVGAGDVRVEPRPAGQRPQGAVSDVRFVVGRAVAGPVAEREVLTTGRVVGPGLLEGQPSGVVALTLPALGASSTGASAGVRVDVYATGSGALVARDVVVLAVSGGGGASGGDLATGAGGGLVGGTAIASGVTSPEGVTIAMDSTAAATVAQHLSSLGTGESFVLAVRRT